MAGREKIRKIGGESIQGKEMEKEKITGKVRRNRGRRKE